VKCGRLYPDGLGRNFPNDIVLFGVTASIERSHTMSDVWREAQLIIELIQPPAAGR
jgi:hypothetical protein